jgi:hypothetical protein
MKEYGGWMVFGSSHGAAALLGGFIINDNESH